MASKLYEVVAAVEHEVSCPVCLEEFQEPKCLPNCAHNVCQECLEEMTSKTTLSSIECPVCRVESFIPRAGVSAFPKNHLLARLIEKNPSRNTKDNEFIKEALKRSKENLEGLKHAIQEMHARRNAIKKLAENLKQEIHGAADEAVKVVRDQEEILLVEVDQYMNDNYPETTFIKQKEKLNNLLAKTSHCIESVEKKKGLINSHACMRQVQHLEELAKVAGVQILSARRKCFRNFELNFSRSEFSEKSVENIVGVVSVKKDLDNDKHSLTGRHESLSSEKVTKHIDGCKINVPNFFPFAVTVSKKTGDIAVLDAENKRVHIFDREGNHLSQFLFIFGDFWDITYSPNDEIVVLNRENNSLLHYDRSGNLKKKFPTIQRSKVKFTFLSHDSTGRFLVTSSPRYQELASETDSCVLIYNVNGKLESVFGKGNLSSPKKAVSLDGEFFVPDADSKSVKVFSQEGEFRREIGNGMLEDLAGIDVDCENGCILVCDCDSYAVHVYSKDGTLVRTIRTAAPPVEIALSRDGKKLVVCFDGDKAKCFQILSYTEAHEQGF